MENIFAILINVALDNAAEMADRINETVFSLNENSEYGNLKQVTNKVHSFLKTEFDLTDHEMSYVEVFYLGAFIENYNNSMIVGSDTYLAMVSVTFEKK